MTPKSKLSALVLVFVLVACTNALLSNNIKLIERIEISPEPEPLLKTHSFCVTDDGIFIVPDYQAGNIKVYEKNGKILECVNTIGRKGYGPGEFSKPSICFYNNDENKFGVMDIGIRKIFIYYRIGRIDFERIDEVFCRKLGDDIQLQGNRLFIAGYLPDPGGNPYDFYYIDLTNNQTTFLLPSYYKYGLKSLREYENQFRKKTDFHSIGINGWFDIYRDDAYFVWEGNLKIIKLNIVSKEITPDTFGIQPLHYVKPYASQELIESRRKLDLKRHLGEKTKMSYVRDIFVSSKYVLLIYEGPTSQDNTANSWLQFYTLDGNFINELPIPGRPNWIMHFDKEGNFLYSLISQSLDENSFDYHLIKYAIYE